MRGSVVGVVAVNYGSGVGVTGITDNGLGVDGGLVLEHDGVAGGVGEHVRNNNGEGLGGGVPGDVRSGNVDDLAADGQLNAAGNEGKVLHDVDEAEVINGVTGHVGDRGGEGEHEFVAYAGNVGVGIDLVDVGNGLLNGGIGGLVGDGLVGSNGGQREHGARIGTGGDHQIPAVGHVRGPGLGIDGVISGDAVRPCVSGKLTGEIGGTAGYFGCVISGSGSLHVADVPGGLVTVIGYILIKLFLSIVDSGGADLGDALHLLHDVLIGGGRRDIARTGHAGGNGGQGGSNGREERLPVGVDGVGVCAVDVVQVEDAIEAVGVTVVRVGNGDGAGAGGAGSSEGRYGSGKDHHEGDGDCDKALHLHKDKFPFKCFFVFFVLFVLHCPTRGRVKKKP